MIQVVRLLLTPLLWLRGRLFVSFKRRQILFASWYMDMLGRLFLRTPITVAGQESGPRSLGPVPADMRDKFYYCKTDRSWGRTQEHFRASIFLALYRVQALKTISWRCFVASALLCASCTVGGGLLLDLVDGADNLALRAAHLVGGNTAAGTHDDTDTIIAPDLQQAMSAAQAQTLTDVERQVSADQCERILYALSTNDAANVIRPAVLADPHKAAVLGARITACRQQGVYYEASLNGAITAAHLPANIASDLFRGAVDHTQPITDAGTNTSTCAQDLAPLRNGDIDHATAVRLVRRLAACQANGFTLEPQS